MFGRKSKRTQKREAHQKALREGLIFWLPGGSSQINVYLDYCVIRCLGKTKMKEKEREIPFTSIRDVIYTPATVSRMASLQLITKEMPDVKRSYWYAYENNLVVVHPGNEELAQKIRQYILNPKGSDVVPPEFLAQLRKERKEERRKAANGASNCATAHVDKVAGAAAGQIAAINAVGLDSLPEELRALAELRLQNPFDSLRELGQKLTPPLSRSGVNHRLEKIIDLAARKD